jgi:hypothetical protein
MGARKWPDVAVLPIPAADGERFVIVETAAMLTDFQRAFLQTSTTEERMAAIHRHVAERPSLTESDVRAALAGRGMTAAQIEGHLTRARDLVRMAVPGSFAFERITRIGYTNADGQQVVWKTDRTVSSGQRVFVMRCGVCGCEYGAYGCDADIRRCPQCQDGPPGVPAFD